MWWKINWRRTRRVAILRWSQCRRGNPHPDPSQRARAGLPSSTGTGSGLYTWLLLKRAISDYAWRVLAYDSAPQDSGPPLIELALARGAHAEGLSVSADALAESLAAVIMDAPAALYQLNRAPAHALEHFSVDLPLARARRQYGDRCGRSRFRRAQRDGCDPAAIPNAENAE